MNYPQAPFEITYQVGATPYLFEVQPVSGDTVSRTGCTTMAGSFLVFLDAEEVGLIRKRDDGSWYWISGGLEGLFIAGELITTDTALELGGLIEQHYR